MDKEKGLYCPFCLHFYKGHTNLFGKICIKCNNYIEPDQKYDVRKKIEFNYNKNIQLLRNYLYKKLGDNNE